MNLGKTGFRFTAIIGRFGNSSGTLIALNAPIGVPSGLVTGGVCRRSINFKH